MRSGKRVTQRSHVRPACDLCHSRKVRCDRKDPCGNCQDGNVPCLRNRPRIGSSRATGSPQRDTQPEQSQRLIPIQPALGDLDSVSQGDRALIPMETGVPFRHEETRSNEIVPFFEDAESFSGYPSAGILHQPQYNLPPARIMDGKSIISYQLEQIRDPTCDRHRALQAALYAAGQLTPSHESIVEHQTVPIRGEDHISLKSPSIEFLEWMLRDIGSDRFGIYVADYLKHVSRDTLREMGLYLCDGEIGDDAVIYTICVNSIAYKFLTTVLSLEKETGLRDRLNQSALEYKEAALVAVQKIPLLAPPSLPLLQAILCGIFLHQGSGNTLLCWELTKTACKICCDLGLGAAFVEGRELSQEAYFCFLWCYTLDKNFAYKLGLPNVQIDVDMATIHRRYGEHSISELLLIYLELAEIQTTIIPYIGNTSVIGGDALSSFAARGEELLVRMDNLQQRINKIGSPSPFWKGLQIHNEMSALRFAYHTVKTDIYHILRMNTRRSNAAVEGCLQSARRELTAMATMCLSQESSQDMWRTAAFLHWTVLFYPLTAFFVLFCNAVANYHSDDFQLLKIVSDCLQPGTEISPPLARVHRLLQAFISISQVLFDGGTGPTIQSHESSHMLLSNNTNSSHRSAGSLSEVNSIPTGRSHPTWEPINSAAASFVYPAAFTGDGSDSHTTIEVFSGIDQFWPWDDALAEELCNFVTEN